MRARVVAKLPGAQASDVAVSPIPGLYEVAMGGLIAYVSADGKYLLSGNVYDLDTQVNLTASRRNSARAKALADAKPAGSGPVVLLDHSDNCASGGTMDTMTVLGAMLDAGLTDAAAFAIFDPAAVQQMIAAGVGSTITLSLGGKLDMPSIGLKGSPRTVTGRVRLVCDGRYRNRGPMGRGELNDMGPTAVLQVAGIDVVVISNHVEPNDMAALTAVGIAPDRLKYLMLKSRIHWRAGLRPMSHATVECAGTGVCSSDYALLGLHKVRRPIYPIDAM